MKSWTLIQPISLQTIEEAMDIFKRSAILVVLSIILCSNCIFLYFTSGLFDVATWPEITIGLSFAVCIAIFVVWFLAWCNPWKYDHSIVKFCFTIITTIILIGSFIILKELIKVTEPIQPKIIPKQQPIKKERFNMRVINNNKKAGYMIGEIVVQFHDNTDQAAAKALIESNGCALKAFSWEKVHIAYVTCPPGIENMKIAQLAPHVKWVERIMNHDFHGA
jgi:hypothetical protein